MGMARGFVWRARAVNAAPTCASAPTLMAEIIRGAPCLGIERERTSGTSDSTLPNDYSHQLLKRVGAARAAGMSGRRVNF
jgi:hypothetical protein